MDSKNLNKFKVELLAEKRQIEDYLKEKATPDQQHTPDPTDTMDEKAQEVTSFEEDRAVLQSMKSRLDQINETLNQIELGTYGTCLNCKTVIDSKRLAAFSTARLCASCAGKSASFE